MGKVISFQRAKIARLIKGEHGDARALKEAFAKANTGFEASMAAWLAPFLLPRGHPRRREVQIVLFDEQIDLRNSSSGE
jgi:hypothetical protein